MKQGPLERTYYPALDVLRGIAIILVFFYHTFHFIPFFEFGWMGVDLFFVLSGFLITDLLLVTQKNKNFFRNFYIRRFLRIFPLYYLVLTVFLVLSPYFFSQQNLNEYSYYNQNQFWFWAQLQNWLFVTKGLGNSPYLSHLWSLAIEEQFYLFWPVLLFLIKDLKKLRWITITLIIIVLITRICLWWQNPTDMVRYYCNTLTRMDSVLMGCLLAIFIKEGKEMPGKALKIISMICLLFFSLLALSGQHLKNTNPLFATFGYTIVSIFFAVLLYVFLKSDMRVLHRLKNSSALGFVGKISYGIYIFHIPVYFVLSSVLIHRLQHSFGMTTMASLFSVAVITLVVTLITSCISFYLLEKPILTLKKHFP